MYKRTELIQSGNKLYNEKKRFLFTKPHTSEWSYIQTDTHSHTEIDTVVLTPECWASEAVVS